MQLKRNTRFRGVLACFGFENKTGVERIFGDTVVSLRKFSFGSPILFYSVKPKLSVGYFFKSSETS